MSGAAAALTLAVVGPTLVDQETRAVVVIGGGVVGLALARHLALSGKQVVVLEKEDTLVAGVSSGNSGSGARATTHLKAVWRGGSWPVVSSFILQ
jgi:glycine/D-amino acid oxidase-like deaminating enzyme